jgi:hypothetical protein
MTATAEGLNLSTVDPQQCPEAVMLDLVNPAPSRRRFGQLVSGTGQFKDKRGVGSLIIKPAGGPNLFMLEGEVGDKP